MTSKNKKHRKLTAKEKKALWKVDSNAGVGWDYPRYRRSYANPAYEPTDPIVYESSVKRKQRK